MSITTTPLMDNPSEHGPQLGWFRRPQTNCPVSFGQFHEIRRSFHVHCGISLVIEKLLPLADHAQVVVIHDYDLSVSAILDRGRQLLSRHLESAIAHEGDHLSIGKRELRSQGCGETKAHRTQPT